MSTMLISLLVVGGAIAVVLWITVGDMGQPATGDIKTADSPPADPDHTPATESEDLASDEVTADEVTEPGLEPEPEPEPEREPVPLVAGTDVSGPAEGTVPQAAPTRPAQRVAAGRAPSRRRRVVALPGSYSFDPAPPVTWARRLRSALGVVLVVTAVGLALAASIGVLLVFVSRALEGAVN